MDHNVPYVLVIVAVALVFDFINGFHDSANSIATVVSTRVLSPGVAVVWAAFFNFVAAFVVGTAVAKTIGKGLIEVSVVDPNVILGGLLGAIVWDLITWYLGLPSSSSHALLGGYAGAAIAKAGFGALILSGWILPVAFIVISPLLGYGHCAPPHRRPVLAAQGSAPGAARSGLSPPPAGLRRPLFAESRSQRCPEDHGNHREPPGGQPSDFCQPDRVAQAPVPPSADHIPLWIVLAAHTAIALGTAAGGWRIVKTMGMRITRLRPFGGFCAETAGGITVMLASSLGVPVSTTHTITGAIVGVGAAQRLSAVRWGVATRIVWAWILTMPMSAVIAALSYLILSRRIGF